MYREVGVLLVLSFNLVLVCIVSRQFLGYVYIRASYLPA
jgi:hypothetical protein